MAAVKFEDALARLETIVTELERGDLPLNDSLKMFEEGIKLSKTCLKMLDDAERKVEIMVAGQRWKKASRSVFRRERRKKLNANAVAC